jgi:hypothetical protein
MKIGEQQVFTHRDEPIADGSFPIRTVTYANAPAAKAIADEAVLHMVVGHGAWSGPTTMGPLMRQALRSAAQDGQPATATLYSDPWFGFGGYASAHRAERFARVVAATADRTERPVHMLAHSWCGVASIEVARRAKREQQVAAYVAYTLTNRIEAGNMTFSSFMRCGLRELGHGNALAGPRSIVTIAAVGAGAIMHSMPALPTAVRECATAFNTRATDELVSLQTALPVGVVLAGKDEFFGHGDRARRHLRSAGFAGAIGIMPEITHLGAVSNYRNGDMLYHVLDATVHPDAPVNDVYYS